MLKPEDFFELNDFEHRALFEGIEFVWEALARLPGYLQTQLTSGVQGTIGSGAVIGDQVYIGPGTVVEPGVTITGPAIIGADCFLRQGAYLREHVILSRGALVGHASEVKHSILLPGASAPHFSYVGDSILGAQVNLGAGTTCSNFRLDGEEIVVEIEGKRYFTGLLKFGAVVGDDTRTGCNCVLNPGTLLGPRSRIYPCCWVRGYHLPDSVVKPP